MPVIHQRDWEAMLACVGRLYECGDIEQFGRAVLTELPRLIGSDHTTFNYLAPSVPQAIVLASYEPPDHAGREQTFARYLGDHPVLKHYLATGDGSAHLMSDFKSAQEYHAMPLYKHFYHGLKYEDQLSVVLFPPGSELVAISLARDCRSFTERDRRLLNLLRPHLARAYRHVERIALLKRTLGAGPAAAQDTRVTSVLLDAHDRPVQFGAEAQRWIDHFFPDRARDASRLPEVVTAWLRHGGTAGQRHPKLSRESDSLVRERDGQVLRLRVIPALSGPGRILVLGLEVAPAAAACALGAEGLTRREIEVLLQVEEGKTNDEAAAALGISPLTVRTHLEHIFEKLRVPSRTAAVTQFRRLCSRLSTAWVGIVIQIFGGDPAAAALILASL